MNGKIRKNHNESFKLKVALAALRANKTVNELSQEFALTAKQIYAWKSQLEERGIEAFTDKRKPSNDKIDVDKLHAIIGKLVVERESLVK